MTSNVNFSGTRKAMDAFESALESLDIILCDENIFTVIEYQRANRVARGRAHACAYAGSKV